jgi:hypothetical protein
MNFMARFLVFLGLIGTSSFCDAADIPCAAHALDRAKQLLTFHSGPDDRMTIDKTVKELPAMRNPEDRTLDPEYRQFGNFNFGAVASALGLSDQEILRGAGAVAVINDLLHMRWPIGLPISPPYGDRPFEQDEIMAGITYYKAVKAGCR